MTVRTKTKREKLAEREEAIVSAARKMFHERGMQAAKMADIAAAAGVAEGTLYLYFKNKEALFAAVVTRHWEDLTEGASRVVAEVDTPRDQLAALAQFTLRRILDDWKLFELSFVLHYGSGDTSDATDKRAYVRIFDGIIERGIDRGDFSPEAPVRLLRDLFFGTMEYAVRSMLRSGKQDDEPAALAMLLKATDGVLMPTAEPQKADLADRLEAAVARLEAMSNR
ncbi:TetR/AcrR family transcriptional regulator [Parvularcula lutaonensis]|uniref:TetR/AcrR family transcriptional regulator n=1 Tax=Parvularcula lutaonensis TaxID=491923 RepID=A0ABV7MAS9_9PROT|nr:TetR/AcrR family transcriptional regulator [Parvularcula lutaonensis]GGY38109.1 TetR family transcriptional regulator [Parvularcula lutaonensis]